MSGGLGGFGVVFGVLLVAVTFVIVAVFALMVVMLVRRSRAVRAEGLDPLTADIQLAGQLRRSQLMAPAAPPSQAQHPRSTSERLAEADELLRAGAITPQEHQAQRARILTDL